MSRKGDHIPLPEYVAQEKIVENWLARLLLLFALRNCQKPSRLKKKSQIASRNVNLKDLLRSKIRLRSLRKRKKC